jgi:hypothetical protein
MLLRSHHWMFSSAYSWSARYLKASLVSMGNVGKGRGEGLTDTIVRSFSFSSIGKLISSGCPDLRFVSSESLKIFYRKYL